MCSGTDQGAAVDLQDTYGWTALMFAAHNDHDRCAKVLIEADADLDRTMPQGLFTALILACQAGHEQCARALVTAGAALNAQDQWGWTSLIYAASNGHEQCARALISPAPT